MRLMILWLACAGFLFGMEGNWAKSYAQALEHAKAQNKKVYMLITSEDCRWCRKFENTTLSEKSTIARLEEKYILVHVDRDKDDFPEKFLRKGVPRHYVVSQNGNVIYTFLGYWNSEDFFSFMQEAEQRFKYMK